MILLKQLRERLSDLEHEQWAHWTRYMLDTIAGENHISEEFEDLPCVRRWRRQCDTPYAQLSEREKESDREWADKVLDTIMWVPLANLTSPSGKTLYVCVRCGNVSPFPDKTCPGCTGNPWKPVRVVSPPWA